MGWLFAILLLILSGMLGFLLYAALNERASLARRVSVLEPEAAAKAVAVAEREKCAAAYNALRKRVQGIVDVDEEKAKVLAEIEQATEAFNAQVAASNANYSATKLQHEHELRTLEEKLIPLRSEHKALSEKTDLLEMGYYKSQCGYTTSQRYKRALDENYENQRKMLTAKSAAICTMQLTIDGSVETGKKQADKTLSLMLRAFNGECDSAVAKVRATNYQAMENRITKSFEAINKLGSTQGCQIQEEYLRLRVEELRLECEHAMKLQAEREEQRAIKEEMRQQALAQKELERAEQDAEREERQYQLMLDRARAEFEQAGAAKQEEMKARLTELERRLAQAHENRERAISRAQQTRAGHVYVISNIGSFGTNVYKIGMTRRYDPMDRVWELSDASVPFDFDVHAIIYTDDAPGLESELHRRFTTRRVNVMNVRKEFFHATIDEIAEVVRERCGDIELTLAAEAAEFFQSEAYRRENSNERVLPRLFEPVTPRIAQSPSIPRQAGQMVAESSTEA